MFSPLHSVVVVEIVEHSLQQTGHYLQTTVAGVAAEHSHVLVRLQNSEDCGRDDVCTANSQRQSPEIDLREATSPPVS